jgi:hypothetical protein
VLKAFRRLNLHAIPTSRPPNRVIQPPTPKIEALAAFNPDSTFNSGSTEAALALSALV